MAYKALYRKYRPDNFDNIVGQEAIIKILQNAVKENKIAHAYLFSGPRGTGKTSVAKLLAKTVNCLDPQNGTACGKCEICKHIDIDNTTDIIEIDAASNNGVDEIRELKNKINFVPSRCKYRVYIVDEVHMLSIGAFNALLKTLEEPPTHVIFILATTEAHKIPLTIVSRCQNLNFKKIIEDKIRERLVLIASEEKIKIEEEAVREIAHLSDGGMRDAIGMLEQLSAFSNDEISLEDVLKISGTISELEIKELLNAIFDNNATKIFDIIDCFYQDGKDFIKITEKIILFLRNVLIKRKAPEYFAETTKNIQDLYNIDNIENNEIYKDINDINTMLTDMRSSSHPKVMFEIMTLKLLNGEDNNASIEQLKKIEKQPGATQIDENKQPEPIEEKTGEKETKDVKEKKEDNKKEHKNILINNTIALAEKAYLNEFIEKWEQLQTFLINKDFKNIATILLDGTVTSASNDHVLITYKYDAMVKSFDDMIIEAEDLIKKLMNRKYTVVAIEENEWQVMRPKYLQLKKEKKDIQILPEEEIEMLKKEKSKKKKEPSKEIKEAINIFGEDLIEMKG